jgi:predicted transcriptional regulator
MGNEKRKRKYFHASSGSSGSVSSQYKMFLVRFHDEESNAVQNDGPHSEEEEAHAILSGYLRRGICSWLVSYNG